MDIFNRIKTHDDIENEAMEYPETQENFVVKSLITLRRIFTFGNK
jgi:hypothetical protein